MNSKISVIIPVYKVERYLDKCIASVANQTYKNLEIILVDDGSPDNCPVICDEWAKKDSRIKVLHKQNGGLSDARNAGLDIASGEYIGFVDSDDTIAPEMYEELLKNLEKEDADISVCEYCYVNKFGYKTEKELQDEEYIVLNTEEALEYRYFGENGWLLSTVTNKLYKFVIWQDLRFEKGKIHEDEFAFNKIIKNFPKMVYIKKPMYLYLANDSGIMANLNYRANINGAQAFIQRGLENLSIDGRWHIQNLKFGAQRFFLARKELRESKKSELLKDIKKDLLCYMYALRKQNKISAQIKFRKSLEIKHPKINELLLILIISIYAPLKKRLRTLLKDKKQFKNNIKRADFILLNTITHGNLGDQAIVLAENTYFNRIKKDSKIFELTGLQTEENLKFLKKIIPKEKTIFIHGGGYIGTIWEKEEERLRRFIKAFKGHRIVLLPQTVTFDMKNKEGLKFFEESKRVFSSHKKLTIFVREQMSFDFMKKNMPKVDCRLVPDIVLSYKPLIEDKTRSGLLLCLRSDREKAIDDRILEKLLMFANEKFEEKEIVFTDTVLGRNVTAEDRQESVMAKLKQFGGAELVITDRLHGMVFALLSKTPCIAMGNINGKVRAVYQWIKDCPFIKYIDRIEELPTALNELEALKETDREYSFDMENFAPLTQLIKEEVK